MQLARVIFDNGFGYGLRYAIKRGSMISPYITQFIELITYVFGREDYYAELYLASLGVHKTMGRDEQALRRMGEALAHINTGETK